MGAASFRDYLRGKFSSLGSCCRWKGRWLRVEERVGGNRRGNACNKSLKWFNSVVPGARKILIGQSYNWISRPPFYAFAWRPTWTSYRKLT